MNIVTYISPHNIGCVGYQSCRTPVPALVLLVMNYSAMKASKNNKCGILRSKPLPQNGNQSSNTLVALAAEINHHHLFQTSASILLNTMQ